MTIQSFETELLAVGKEVETILEEGIQVILGVAQVVSPQLNSWQTIATAALALVGKFSSDPLHLAQVQTATNAVIADATIAQSTAQNAFTLLAQLAATTQPLVASVSAIVAPLEASINGVGTSVQAAPAPAVAINIMPTAPAQGITASPQPNAAAIDLNNPDHA